MGMPTDEELAAALTEAARMREQGQDPHHLAKALLNLHYQNQQLQKVRQAVELFLHSGLAVTEHQRLKKALAEAGAAIERTKKVQREDGFLL